LHVLMLESFLLCSLRWCDLLWSISTCVAVVGLISEGFLKATLSILSPIDFFMCFTSKISSSFDVELSLPRLMLPVWFW
jgi:hypothetical protein